MDFIRTANSDKRSDPEDEDFLCFTLAAPSTVYVLYDSRATDGMEPGWLTRDFADEHLEVAEVDDASMGTMELHFADKPAGRVCIGGNNADGVGSNYMVAVGPVVDHSGQVVPGGAGPALAGQVDSMCDGDVCTVVNQVATSGAGVTFRLSVVAASAFVKNIYSIFGDNVAAMTVPAAYQEAAPFGANTGGVSPALAAVSPTAAYDSWLTVGITEGDDSGSMGTVGIPYDTWTASTGLSVDNGAVFWMAPDDAPQLVGGAEVVVAQLTIRAGRPQTAVMSAQGQSLNQYDWKSQVRCEAGCRVCLPLTPSPPLPAESPVRSGPRSLGPERPRRRALI